MPGEEEMPATIRRSPPKAQRTWVKTTTARPSSTETASALTAPPSRRSSTPFEKVGDHWEEKDEKGPSDPQAASPGADARAGRAETYGGVDVLGNSKRELYERARKLGVSGRSSMSKEELARAIQRKQ